MFLYFIIPSFQNKRNIYREHQIRKMSTTAISRSVIEMLQGIETAILIRKAELTMLAQTISHLRHHRQIKYGLWLYIKRRSDTDTQMEFLGKTPIPTSDYGDRHHKLIENISFLRNIYTILYTFIIRKILRRSIFWNPIVTSKS